MMIFITVWTFCVIIVTIFEKTEADLFYLGGWNISSSGTAFRFVPVLGVVTNEH
jgi:hypothetical protein